MLTGSLKDFNSNKAEKKNCILYNDATSFQLSFKFPNILKYSTGNKISAVNGDYADTELYALNRIRQVTE